MGRTRARLFTVLAMLTGLAPAGPARAQAPASADGWVVLSVDEYRTLRERWSVQAGTGEAARVKAVPATQAVTTEAIE